MAEKEERISVIVYEKDPCKNCPGNPMTDCQVCEKDLRYDGGMTHQEAIERMAMAMHNEDIKRSIKDIPCDYRNLAEAALTAIAPMIPQEEEQNER